MKIYVKNVKAAGVTKGEITKAVKFFTSKLMSKRLADTLYINIEFDENLGYAGLATWLDEPVRPKEFSIRINPKHEEPILVTLAHELVHVKQYAKGMLRDLIRSPDQVVWNGARQKCNNHDGDYRNQPWEIEAYAREWELYEAYLLEGI